MNAIVCASASASVTVDARTRVDEAGAAVVLLVPVVHRGEDLVGLVDHQLGTGRDLGEVAVGEDRRDLDDALALGFEPGHLHVEPDQDVGASHAADDSSVAVQRRCVEPRNSDGSAPLLAPRSIPHTVAWPNVPSVASPTMPPDCLTVWTVATDHHGAVARRALELVDGSPAGLAGERDRDAPHRRLPQPPGTSIVISTRGGV